MRIFDENGVFDLLRSEVKRAGSQRAWAKKAGVNRTMLNKILNNKLPPTKKILSVLNLRTVYVSKMKRSGKSGFGGKPEVSGARSKRRR